tara:strand:+ start:449 stop:583 length:135 start_codon:yes stop_codon:yes gene_type:complete
VYDDEGLEEWRDYLDQLEHEEDTRALEYHLEGVADGYQVKGWYK